MLCINCGAQNDENAAFCISCGTKLESQPAPAPTPAETTPEQPAPARKPRSKWPLLIGIAGAAVTFVVALVLLLSMLGNGTRSPKAVGRQLAKAMNKGDAKAIIHLIHKDVLEEEIGDKQDIKDAIEELAETMEFSKEWQEELGYTVSYSLKKVTSADRYDKQEIKEDYEDYYYLDVKDVKTLVIKVERTDEDGDKDSDTYELLVVKIGNKWYLADLDF